MLFLLLIDNDDDGGDDDDDDGGDLVLTNVRIYILFSPLFGHSVHQRRKICIISLNFSVI